MAYELTRDFYYPLAEVYEGAAQKVRLTFDAPAVGTDWFADSMIDNFEEETENQGESILRIRIWEDHAPIFETKFYVEFVITSQAGSSAPVVGLGAAAIVIIIAACLIVLGIILYRILKILDAHWPEVAKTAKWIGIGLASVAVIALVVLLPRLPKRKEVTAE